MSQHVIVLLWISLACIGILMGILFNCCIISEIKRRISGDSRRVVMVKKAVQVNNVSVDSVMVVLDEVV